MSKTLDRKTFRDLLIQRVIDYLNDYLWDLGGEPVFTKFIEEAGLKNVPEQAQDWTEEVSDELQVFIHEHFKPIGCDCDVCEKFV